MSADRELLELAAKAAGIDLYVEWNDDGPTGRYRIGADGATWNPLHDDGDALRLAVRLRLLVNISHVHTVVVWYDEARSESHEIEQWDNGMTPEQRTRLAIVCAAAEIGKTK